MLLFNEKECLEPLIILIGIYGCDPPNGTHFEKEEGEHDPKETSEGPLIIIPFYVIEVKSLGERLLLLFQLLKLTILS